jgi:hypothetical protein
MRNVNFHVFSQFQNFIQSAEGIQGQDILEKKHTASEAGATRHGYLLTA